MSKEDKPTQWHPIFAELLRPMLQDYYEVQTNVPVGDAPCEADIVLVRRTSNPPTPFRGLWRHLKTWNVLEFKGPSVSARLDDLNVLIQQFPARVFGSARFSCFIARRACGLGRRGDCGGGDRALVRIHAGRRCWVRTATIGHPCPLLEVVRIRSSCSQLSAGNGRHLDQLKGEQHFVQMSDRFQTKAVKQVPHAFPKSTFAAQFVQHGLKQRIA